MHVLGIDAGTSSCKVGVFSPEGLVAAASRGYGAMSTRQGISELDAAGTWTRIEDAVREVLSNPAVPSREVRAISFSSMGEAAVPVRLDRTVVGPSILANDARGVEYAVRLDRDMPARDLYRISPNRAGPNFTFSKLMWIRDHDPDTYRAADKFLFWADFIAFMLGADPFASNSLANRSLLLDVRENRWSDVLLEWSGIDRDKLGDIVSGGDVVGAVQPDLARRLGLRDDVLLVAGGHDQVLNALGCGCIESGSAVVGMGTYESYCPIFSWPGDTEAFFAENMNIEHHVVPGLFASFLYHHSGYLVDWFRRTFAPNETLDDLNARLPDGPTRLLFLPHNEPPQWPEFIRHTSGVFVGLKSSTTLEEMYRAVLEGITFYLAQALTAMERTGVLPDVFLASGGGSRSDAWMQIRADITGKPFTRLGVGEGSLNGAAILAAVKAGLFPDNAAAAKAYVRRERTFVPDSDRHASYSRLAGVYRNVYPSLAGVLESLDQV